MYVIFIKVIIILQLQRHQMLNTPCYSVTIFTKRIVKGGGLTKLEPHIFRSSKSRNKRIEHVVFDAMPYVFLAEYLITEKQMTNVSE